MKKTTFILKSTLAILIASSLFSVANASASTRITYNKKGLTEVKEFIMTLPTETQTALMKLHEKHRSEMRELLESYNGTIKNEFTENELSEKVSSLQTKHLFEIKMLLKTNDAPLSFIS